MTILNNPANVYSNILTQNKIISDIFTITNGAKVNIIFSDPARVGSQDNNVNFEGFGILIQKAKSNFNNPQDKDFVTIYIQDSKIKKVILGAFNNSEEITPVMKLGDLIRFKIFDVKNHKA